MKFTIRKAQIYDVQAIRKLVKHYAEKGMLLDLPTRDIKKSIKSFFVAINKNKVVGCACLEIYNKKMAEIRSLAVDPQYNYQGIGTILVEKCLERAKKRKILEVMVITSSAVDFFKKLKFDYTLPRERKALFFNP